MASRAIAEAAPAEYQAEIVRGQICDDLDRRFWRGRQKLADAIEDKKDRVHRDYNLMSAKAFVEKYSDWRFL